MSTQCWISKMAKRCAIRCLFILCALLSLQARTGQAQDLGYYTGPLKVAFPNLTYYPPLSTGMPLDVLLGYVYYDSIARTVPMSTLRNTYLSMGYSDTLRSAAKYLYIVDDYDPIRFMQYLQGAPSGLTYNSGSPRMLRDLIYKTVSREFPDSMRTERILEADYIAHIYVTSVVQSLDGDTVIPWRTAQKVSCNVLDLIKGQVLPGCTPDTSYRAHSREWESRILDTVLSQGCLQFDYRLEWPRSIGKDIYTSNDSVMTRNGLPWVVSGKEYIVYLYLHDLGRDSSMSYATMFPSMLCSTVGGLYPVDSNVVYDPNDDMGFGTNLSPTSYKAALRSKIFSILHP